MDEHILFHNAGVKITSQQLIVPGHVYVLNEIESAEFIKVEPKRTVAIVLLCVGMFLLLSEGHLFALGGFSVLMSIVIWISGNTQYRVMITTATGNHEVLNSMDRAYVEKVLHALDAAMLKSYPKTTSSANSVDAFEHNTNDISVGTS